MMKPVAAVSMERLCSTSTSTTSRPCFRTSPSPRPNLHPVPARHLSAPSRAARPLSCASYSPLAAAPLNGHGGDGSVTNFDAADDEPAGITLNGSVEGITFTVSGAATVSMPPGGSVAHSGGANTMILPPGTRITMPKGSAVESPWHVSPSPRSSSPGRAPSSSSSSSSSSSTAEQLHASTSPLSPAAGTSHSNGNGASAPSHSNGNGASLPAQSAAPGPSTSAQHTAAPHSTNGASTLPLPSTSGRPAAPAPLPRALSVAAEDDAKNGRVRRDGGASNEYYTHLENRKRGNPTYSRVMLKVSGEALKGSHGFGTDPDVLRLLAAEIRAAYMEGIEICIVVGGGNYFRGASAWEGLNRSTADYVGMLATVMNALCLQAALEQLNVPTRVQTAIEMREVAEPYVQRRAIRHLEEGRVVIFGAGTGNPFFTTDTAAALRAAEMDADVFLKATKVDGVYDSDPMKNPGAKRYHRLSFKQVTVEDLQVMDQTAITLCKENNIPVIVFSIAEPGNILRAARGETVGTTVCSWDEANDMCMTRAHTSGGTAS